MSSYFSQSRLIWKPALPQHTGVESFRRMINRKHGLNLKDYHDLHKYSVEDYTFWLDLWEYLGIICSTPPQKVIEKGSSEEGPLWFPDTRLNYAENLLYRKDDAIACSAVGESGIVKHYSYRVLRKFIREMAAAMRVNGLTVGDRVAGVVTNSITALVIALATASIGGIFSSTATDMGAQGILDRYRQIRPKFIFAETEVLYAGKVIDLTQKIYDVVQDLTDKGLEIAVLLPSTLTGKDRRLKNMSKCISLSEFIATGDGRPLSFKQLPFNQPLFILYSSGTSGPPKCIVHSAGGVLLQTKKELSLSFGISPGDTYLQYTTTGWMMWTLMLTGLACGSRLLLYDGSPLHPDVPTFLKLINDQDVSVLGTSPRFLAEVQGQGINPLDLAPFESLHTIVCTGSVLTAPMFEWAQRAFGEQKHLISTSGGTDVCTSFVTGSSCLPVYAGEIQCKAIGMKVEVFDQAGNNIEHTGQPGELVCTRPHPSIPVCFWGDESGKKFHDAYFSTYPGVWRQGDFIVVNPRTKGLMLLGRSDGVLNPGGVRFGSGEIYSVLEQFREVINDSLCVGQRRSHDKDERVLLFLKMRTGHRLTNTLEGQIRHAIRTRLSARHVPAFIFEIGDIPYTVNGKKIEIAIKQIVSGSDLKPSGTVANPESLELYYKYRDIEKLTGRSKAKL